MTPGSPGRPRLASWLQPVTALALALTLAAPADADQDPSWRWRTLETEHFRVHYYEGLGRIARRVAIIAERTHAQLTEELDWSPRRPTHLVVLDDTDYAQGITYVGAQNLIRLWVVAPEDESVLEDFDDWLELLITHEYTHLVHIDQARGLPAVINAILGQIYHPMQFTPSWLTEGYAVHEESRQTTGGRVRSAAFDMYLRMAVLEDDFLRIDQATNGTRDFPQGNVPYLYGQDFMNYVARRFGNDVLARLAHEMGDDPVPYGLNRAFRRVTGHTVVELWDDWRRSLEVGYRAMADRLSEQGLTDSRALTDLGERMGPPRFSPDGEQIYVYHSTEQAPSALWSVTLEDGTREQVTLTSGRTVLSPSPDGRFLYYARGDRHDIVYQYRDLFRLDLRSGQEERLTDGARALSVDLSPDGRQVAYSTFRADSSDLWLANTELGRRRRLITSAPGEQVYSPRFSPDGATIAISHWSRGGDRDIQLVDVEDGSIRELTHDRHLDNSPCFSPDGRWVVFSSDRTGVINLYAYDLENDALRQVTNVISGASMPDISPDGETIAFVSFSSRGYDLHVMPFDPAQFRAPQPERERPEEPVVEQQEQAIPEMRDRRYSPWSTLRPRSWLLGLTEDAWGQALQLTTSGADASGRHAFAGQMTVGFERGDIAYDLTYEYRRFRPNITIRHARWTAPRQSLRVDTSSPAFTEETLLGTVDLSVFLGRGVSSHRLWTGWELRYTRATTDLTDQRWDPSGRPPRFPEHGLQSGLRFGWSFSNARSSVRSISLETGRSLRASLSLFHPAFGSEYFQLTFRYRWSEYITMPWLRHHVLALSLGGGISAGEIRNRPFYLGGIPEQNLIGALIEQSFYGGNFLRGYPPGVIGGAQYHMLNVEYRFPLWNPERGISTLPVYVSHLWMAAFCDVGGAFAENLDVDELLVGVGGEVIIRLVIGYFLAFNLRLGYARGLMEGGDNQFFAYLGLPF